MLTVPVYLKFDEDTPRPTDPVYYWITRSGVYLCRNNQMFASDVKVNHFPRNLAFHQDRCLVDLPRLSATALEYIVGFFSRVFELYQSEAIVLLFFDPQRKRYKLIVPKQTATVWQTSSGFRTPLDVTYEVPVKLLGKYILLGDIHCHGDMSSYASHTDQLDEEHRDGVHAVVGYIDREPPSFHVELSIDGSRYALNFDDVFSGYRGRRHIVPKKWLDQVEIKIKVSKPIFTNRDRSY